RQRRGLRKGHCLGSPSAIGCGQAVESMMPADAAERSSYIKQRQAPRQRENRTAWIDRGSGELPEPQLWDISDAGVRINVDSPLRVPFEFFLVLSKDGKTRRKCRVVWRSEDQLGARYLAAPAVAEPA